MVLGQSLRIAYQGLQVPGCPSRVTQGSDAVVTAVATLSAHDNTDTNSSADAVKTSEPIAGEFGEILFVLGSGRGFQLADQPCAKTEQSKSPQRIKMLATTDPRSICINWQSLQFGPEFVEIIFR